MKPAGFHFLPPEHHRRYLRRLCVRSQTGHDEVLPVQFWNWTFDRPGTNFAFPLDKRKLDMTAGNSLNRSKSLNL